MKIDVTQGFISKLETIKQSNRIILRMLKKLSEVKPGLSVRIKSFSEQDIVLKLMEMGCLPGETIWIEKIAPLGDPISIKVSGYTLSLRLNEAETILVEDVTD